MYEELIIVEQENVVIVAWADDPEDWVVRFHKQPGFHAIQWAKRIIFLNNQGSRSSGLTLPDNNANNPKAQSNFHP